MEIEKLDLAIQNNRLLLIAVMQLTIREGHNDFNKTINDLIAIDKKTNGKIFSNARSL